MSYAAGIRDGLVHGYCAPAVKSMSESWRPFLYAGYDPAASITLDKLPGAFMVEALSARVFGFSTWSILLPQVIETVIAILLPYGVGSAQRQVFLPPPLATTPIVAALAHVKISDTLLTLLLILAADACLRAVAGGRLGWLLVAGVWMGTRVPNQDGVGGGRPPSTRACVSPCRARPAATALRSCCARRRGHSRCVHVLDRHGPADTRLGTAQCGRFAGQIAARDGVRVQPAQPLRRGQRHDTGLRRARRKWSALSFMLANSVAPQIGLLR